MNDKALLGKLLILFAVVIILISAGTMFYLKLTKDKLEFSTGKVTINVAYNDSSASVPENKTAEEISVPNGTMQNLPANATKNKIIISPLSNVTNLSGEN